MAEVKALEPTSVASQAGTKQAFRGLANQVEVYGRPCPLQVENGNGLALGSALHPREHNALNKVLLGKEENKHHRQHRHQ